MKKGFTLAEVLITLGIIGVVAAITIPTLVADYQAKSWSTSAQVFERKLEEALKVMNTQSSLAGYTTTEAFVDELKKHIKILKTCDNTKLDSCFPKTFTYGFPETETMDITTFTDSSKLRKEPFGTNTVGVQFANGVSGVLAYDPKCKQDPFSNTISGMGCISMIYDTSGDKSPNTSNKDLRMLNVNTLYAFKIGGTKYGAPFVANTPHAWNACEPITGITNDQEDLAYMSKYGLQYCYAPQSGMSMSGDDYWAGAVELCGHKNKVASMEQIAEIANYLYNTNNITAYGHGYEDSNGNTLELDFKKASSLGFNSKQFDIWSNEEILDYGTVSADFRKFAENVSLQTGSSRNSNEKYIVCVVD